MRNLFDQYTQPENRLSHALAVCLNEDRKLLRDFIRWAGVRSHPKLTDLVVTEQSLPGDLIETDENAEDEGRGLPDIIIHDIESWCLLIESKIQAGFKQDQLIRHRKTLSRRGFEHVHVLAMTKKGAKIFPNTINRTWFGLYEWLGKKSQHCPWSERLRDYLRVAEVRMARDEYLTEGTLTMFDGFPFSEKNPYNYGEAKRLIKLAMVELRKNKSLKKLGMDPDAPGRKKITGKLGGGVWDYLSLNDRPRNGAFTSFPHLTLAIREDLLVVAVTIPNGVIPAARSRIVALESNGLSNLNQRILRKARRLLNRGAWIDAYALQRHYRSQSAPPTRDAELRFNLETSLAGRGNRTKHQPEWAETFLNVLEKKRSNIQFGYEIKLPWGMRDLNSCESLNLIADAWCAMAPLLETLCERKHHSVKRHLRRRSKG